MTLTLPQTERLSFHVCFRWPGNEMLLRNKIVSLSETGDIDKMMQHLAKAKTCSVDIYLFAYSSFVEKGHIAIAMPILKEGLHHFPENQVRSRCSSGYFLGHPIYWVVSIVYRDHAVGT